ncbi:EVE domain-containing protein [Marinobacter sp. OP 3.4]|uniref:EVE domain-containing protein n=1 Tax=Marinobacter sp. OP 3.4 TaxID=3076501 RepID=UPI002E218A02
MAKWLVKSEPDECGIDDFATAPDRVIPWDGVRNYQARNFLRQMNEGDQVLLYHSSCRHIGVAGVVTVVRAAYPDPTQFDPSSPYHDPKATREKPRWDAVDMQFVRKLPRIIPLAELKAIPALADMPLVRKGNRLSVMPVTDDEWAAIPDPG